MKIFRLMLVSFVALGIVACTERKGTSATEEETQASKVFLTKDISPEGLVKAFQALGVAPQGKVAVKTLSSTTRVRKATMRSLFRSTSTVSMAPISLTMPNRSGWVQSNMNWSAWMKN